MTKRKKYPKVDYVFVSAKKEPEPPSTRKIIRSFMNGTTLVQRIIDKDHERIVPVGRYSAGME